MVFPFLLGRAFIEAAALKIHRGRRLPFPFLFGGAFIEAMHILPIGKMLQDFPAFS